MLFGPKVSLEIDTDKNDYFLGDTVGAVLRIKTNKEFDFSEIRLEMICETALRYEVTRRYSLYSYSMTEDEDPDEMVVEVQTFKLTELKKQVMGEGKVPREGLVIEGELNIPSNSPPTYNGGLIKTKWILKAVINRKRRRDIVAKKEIVIKTKITDRELMEKIEEKRELDKALVFLELPKRVFSFGEIIRGEVRIKPKESFEVEKLDIDLLSVGRMKPEKVLKQPIPSIMDFRGSDTLITKPETIRKDLSFREGVDAIFPFDLKVPDIQRPTCLTEYYDANWSLRIILRRKRKVDLVAAFPIILTNAIG